jgi:SAM-dependent methyltransferase
MSKSKDRFSKQADLYAKYRPGYPEEMFTFIFEHLNQKKIAWDCATGSGQVAHYLSNYFDKVFANDISKEQLSYAPKKSNIIYQNTRAEDSKLPNDTFDLITIAQAIHWLNFDQFYDEVHRTARKNSLLAVIGYGMIRISDAINPIIDELYEEAFGQYFNKNRTYLDKQYQTIPFPYDEISAPDFKITYQWSLSHLKGYFNSWSAIQKIKTEQNYNPVDKTISELNSKLFDTKNIQVNFPIFLRLGRIH